MMKLFAKPVPYSSIVGGGVTLIDENEQPKFIINFIGTTKGISKKQNDEIAKQIIPLINKTGIDVSEDYPL